MRPNDGSLPGRRMAQERLDAVRRALSEAPLPLKIVLVAALLLLAVIAALPLIVAAFIYAPIAVFAGHRSLVASLAVAVWGLEWSPDSPAATAPPSRRCCCSRSR